jgi:hypothetical protein
MSVASEERAALVRTLRMVAPDASTLCPGWTPRALDDRTVGALRRLTRFFAPVLMPGVPARVTLRESDGAVLARFGAGAEVTITGAPGELLLFAFGRNEIRVEFSGDADAVVAVRHAERRF